MKKDGHPSGRQFPVGAITQLFVSEFERRGWHYLMAQGSDGKQKPWKSSGGFRALAGALDLASAQSGLRAYRPGMPPRPLLAQ